MTELVIEQPPAVAAFASKRNSNEERIKRDEEYLEQLKKEAQPKQEENTEEENLPTPSSAEEKTYAKRYGDLRRHSQKMQADMQKQIDAMKEQLEAATRKEMKMPKSEEDLQAWAEQFPDVYKIIETIAIKKNREQAAAFEERLKRVDEMEKGAQREKAEAELLRLHPDFDSIREDDAFHEWVEAQPKWVQQALYENDNDAHSAARAIDLYKADKGSKRSQNNSNSKGVAAAINTRGSKTAPANNGAEGLIYESQIAKMNARDYERNQEEILKAIRTGKFVYDISGTAR